MADLCDERVRVNLYHRILYQGGRSSHSGHFGLMSSRSAHLVGEVYKLWERERATEDERENRALCFERGARSWRRFFLSSVPFLFSWIMFSFPFYILLFSVLTNPLLRFLLFISLPLSLSFVVGICLFGLSLLMLLLQQWTNGPLTKRSEPRNRRSHMNPLVYYTVAISSSIPRIFSFLTLTDTHGTQTSLNVPKKQQQQTTPLNNSYKHFFFILFIHRRHFVLKKNIQSDGDLISRVIPMR